MFAKAASTHTGIASGGIGSRYFDLVFFRFPERGLVNIWHIAIVPGLLYLAARRRVFLLLWLFGTAYVIDTYTFLSLIGTFIAGAVIVRAADFLSVAFETSESAKFANLELAAIYNSNVQPIVTLLIAGLLIVSGVDAAFYAGGYPEYATNEDRPDQIAGSSLGPSIIQASGWLRNHTAPTATVAGQSGTAEWLPYLSHRTLAIGPWGREWRGDDVYRRHTKLQSELTSCGTPYCISEVVANASTKPEYIVLAKGRINIDSFNNTISYTHLYQNDRWVVYKTTY